MMFGSSVFSALRWVLDRHDEGDKNKNLDEVGHCDTPWAVRAMWRAKLRAARSSVHGILLRFQKEPIGAMVRKNLSEFPE